MNEKDQVIKHLEMIQGVINRLAHNSFLIKGWSMTILAASIIFISKNTDAAQWLILCFLIPVMGFWILDGYFLWQERIFRGIYDDIRKQKSTDFSMPVLTQKSKADCKFIKATFSITLVLFYFTEIIFIILSFFILNN